MRILNVSRHRIGRIGLSLSVGQRIRREMCLYAYEPIYRHHSFPFLEYRQFLMQ